MILNLSYDEEQIDDSFVIDNNCKFDNSEKNM